MIVLKVSDSFYIRDRGQGVSFDSYDPRHRPKVNSRVVLTNGIDVIDTIILYVETFARAVEYDNDSFAILLRDPQEKRNLKDWDCIFYENDYRD